MLSGFLQISFYEHLLFSSEKIMLFLKEEDKPQTENEETESQLNHRKLPGQERNDLGSKNTISLSLVCKLAGQTMQSVEFLPPLTLGSVPQNT